MNEIKNKIQELLNEAEKNKPALGKLTVMYHQGEIDTLKKVLNLFGAKE